jgi:hypothetical protein
LIFLKKYDIIYIEKRKFKKIIKMKEGTRP